MLASFPCAAMFWCSYEFSKYQLKKNSKNSWYFYNIVII